MQVFAERVEQCRARIDHELVRLAIDLELNRDRRRIYRSRTPGDLCGLSQPEPNEGSESECRAGSRYLLEEMTPRRGTAENKEVIQAAGWIDCRQLAWIDRLKILVVHPFWNRSPPP
jgi:hypothetical protein